MHHRFVLLAALAAVSAAAPASAATLTRAHAVLPASKAAAAPAAPTAPDVGAQSIGDSIFPTIGNGGYDAQHYDLNLTYVPGAHLLEGTTTMTAVATQPLREFSMDFDGFTIVALTVNGIPATNARASDNANKLVIDPATPLKVGERFSVAVTYAGSPPVITDEDNSQEGFLPDGDGAMVVCEPVGSMGWFPNNDTPADKATYDISLTVPVGMTVLANGQLVSSDVGATGQTWHWRESEPMASYLATATLGHFQVRHDTTADGINIDIGVALPYAFPPVDDGTLDRLPEILSFLESLYGPYPFTEAGAIVAPAPVTYALETQTKPNFPLPPDPVTLAHETAHQYWGDSLALNDWKDIWLNEGFATWSEWAFDERRNGGATLASDFAGVYAKTGTYWSLPPANPGSGANIFSTEVYERGGATLEGLHQIVGEDAFLNIMRTWYARNRNGNVDTAGFIAVAKELGGVDQDRLGDYLQQWLYGTTKPTITPQTF